MLKPTATPADRDLLVGLGVADDAAVYRIAPDLALVETVDFFPPVVDDPYTWGAVAAANAMSDELVIVVPAGHPWAARPTVTLADVKAEPLIVRERGSGSRDALEQALREAGTDLGAFRIAGEIGSTQAVKQAVRAGAGITIISRRAVADECRAHVLVCVRLSDLRVARSFYLVLNRDRTRSPLAQAFMAFVESQARELPS